MRTATLLEAFSQLDDPRCLRGVRHPFAGIVVLMLLGMLARIREMEVKIRWATVHWDQLQGPLGFDREEPPCATMISRTLAKCRVADFQTVLAVCLTEELLVQRWFPFLADFFLKASFLIPRNSASNVCTRISPLEIN